MDSSLKWGCGTALSLFLLAVLGPTVAEIPTSVRRALEDRRHRAEERQAAERARDECARRLAEQAAREVEKTRKIRDFALEHARAVWNVYCKLDAEIQVCEQGLERLRESLEEFGRVPEEDYDYRGSCERRDAMKESQVQIRRKLEDAYLASLKFEVAQSSAEYAELMQSALQEGIREAERAQQKFDMLKKSK